MNVLSSSMMFELNVISPKDARQHLDFPQQLGLSKCALSTCVFQDEDSDGKTCQSLQSLLDPQFWLRYRLIYAGWYQECDFSQASISRVRPLGQFAARAWQACGCWKPTAACARQCGSSCEWTCSKIHHFDSLLYQASFALVLLWPVECLTHVHQFNCWWNIIMKHSR